MKSRPILFSGPMVRAILDGRKTQTRRVVKSTGFYCVDARFHSAEDVARELRSLATQCPYGAPGDELWVRETFGVLQTLGADRDHDGERYVYRADPASDYQWSAAASQGFRWKPSIFMPRSVSRLTLVVKSVRVERLSLISGEDVVAEGFDLPHGVDESHVARDRGNVSTRLRFDYIAAFRAMHNLAADADPWLWVVTFRKQGGAS